MPARILLTRPEGENAELAQRLVDRGYEVRCLPLLGIDAICPGPAQRLILQNLDQYDLVFVASRTAARLLAGEVRDWWPQWPGSICWVTPGAGTAAILEAEGLPTHYPELRQNSEGVLELMETLCPNPHRALVVQGEGGRDTIFQTLQRRGVAVDQLPLYRRRPLDYDSAQLRDLLINWRPDVLFALSGETLHQLATVVNNVGLSLADFRLVLPSARIGMAPEIAEARITISPDMRIDTLVEAVGTALTTYD